MSNPSPLVSLAQSCLLLCSNQVLIFINHPAVKHLPPTCTFNCSLHVLYLTTTCTDHWQSTTSCQYGLLITAVQQDLREKGLTAPFLVLAAFSTISSCLQKKLLKPPTPFFQDQMKNGFKLISLGRAALKFCLPDATSCLSQLMIILKDDYWTGLFSSPVIVGNLWDHELVYMSLINDSPGLLTVAGCW